MSEKFSKLKKMMGKPKKAMSELEASKDPMGFIEKNKNMSIKGLRGVAFSRGGTVKGRGR
jgi:hypothetical protein